MWFRRSGTARLLALPFIAAGIAGTSGGCVVVQRLGGTATVDLSRAQLRRMTVSLRKPEQTFCPREQVQMAVFITAVPEGGGTDEKTYETYEGRGAVNKNDKLDFASFAFQSEQAQFDADGWMAPLQVLPATAGHELVVHATYNPSPLVFSYTYKFKPDYACITSAAAAGPGAAAGAPGKDGAKGKLGDGGGVMSTGGDGQDGAPGGAGGDGAQGGVGPKVHAVVTYVKTPFYEKLIGVRLTGGITDFLLVHPGRPFAIHATGGPGGSGGAGGRGGDGGAGAAGNGGGHGGNGGPGGSGGRGGVGGTGGAIDLVFDSRFPDLATAITLDVAGGPGGAGGKGGSTGDGGPGGRGTAPVNSPSTAPDGAKGHGGADGGAGGAGHSGANGTAAARPGPIGDAFAGLTDITVLTAAVPARAAH